MQDKVHHMKVVVNDCAERGIASVQKFNSSVTKNQNQKHYFLRLVDLHRQQYPDASNDENEDALLLHTF